MEAKHTPEGWNVFKQIFKDHWEGFKQRHLKYNTLYYDELVRKMLSCGNEGDGIYKVHVHKVCRRSKSGVNELQGDDVFEMWEGICG
ncbi:MAG: hypothetical protein U0586_08080 [Candidatus Brocadiaceae bacterium]